MTMTFESFSFKKELTKALTDIAFLKPTTIQERAIPLILAKHDVMARAKTGTGKTASFALPILNELLSVPHSTNSIKALVLTPTRELAKQVYSNFESYSKYTEIRIGLVYGGANYKSQITQLSAGVDILIATPGRLLDYLTNNMLNLSDVSTLVFDEADRMLDLGFKNEIDSILSHLPKQRQTLLFSATFDQNIYDISRQLLLTPKTIEIDEGNCAANDIEQIVYKIDNQRKREFVSFLIGSKNWQQVLVFVRTKKLADELAAEMKKDGLKSAAFHGDKTQGYRDKTLSQFKNKEIRVLIATDVAARGIDIEDLPYVINFELPHQAEDYIHRIGRTGRAGKSGTAISLVTTKEQWLLEAIEKLLEQSIIQQWYPGFEPSLDENSDIGCGRKESKRRSRNKALGVNSNKKKNKRNYRR